MENRARQVKAAGKAWKKVNDWLYLAAFGGDCLDTWAKFEKVRDEMGDEMAAEACLASYLEARAEFERLVQMLH